MQDRRGSRFALEVLFLVGLAVALTLADLEPLEIGGIMLLGWLIVALLEWVAWRERPHYGSGLPPKYYVPQVSLPPAQPLEQVSAGYPEARDEAPTWIASATMREELLGEWPVALRPITQVVEEPDANIDPDPWTHPEELPVAPLGEPEPQLEPEPDPESELGSEPEPVAPTEPEPPSRQPPEPIPVALPVTEAEPERESEPAREVEPVALAASVAVARYSLDPLAEPQPRRRFGRRPREELQAVEVPARPGGIRALPGQTRLPGPTRPQEPTA